MGWRAETTYGEIAQGTILSIYFEPWAEGVPGPLLTVGAEIPVHLSTTATKIKVVEVSGGDAVIRTADDTAWTMTEINPESLAFPPADTGGAPTTYWQVWDHPVVEAPKEQA